MCCLLTMALVFLTFSALFIAPVLSQVPAGSFCAHLKTVIGHNLMDGIWLPCKEKYIVSNVTNYHYLDINASTTCTFYDELNCDLSAGGAYQCVKSPQRIEEAATEELERDLPDSVESPEATSQHVPAPLCGHLTKPGGKPISTPLYCGRTCNDYNMPKEFAYLTVYPGRHCDFYKYVETYMNSGLDEH
ncbi:hypothetical protein BU23DRAFT_568743 [Bimuria novae-zelandiae CBS 107.79]|uniref:Uncharacterized protein n=1 Tax=Bimuria novae-zelandiae CBS 107.79 TaxID=1447943 RepID=A0A6A5V8A1_9PLEO|nr:hypothetical protein BU23DRAFT_568743 [Bimuria novae-zelandiae CBS 107.79]